MIAWVTALALASPEEDALLDLIAKEQYLSARPVAEGMIARDPESIAGHFALGRVLADAEGNLGQARYELELADSLYDERYADASGDGIPWKLHSDVVYALYNVCQLQEDYVRQLEVMDHHDERFDPDVGADRGWPLMKLGRADEARRWAEFGVASSEFWQQSSGHNTLCVLEAEDGRRQASADACEAALTHEYTSATPDPTVDAANAASAAMSIVDFATVEKHLRLSTRGSTTNATNPWGYLVDLYALEGRGSDGLAAVQQMQAWRAHQPADMRDQGRAGVDRWLATFLMVAGRPDKGLPIITRAIDFPDRRGMNSDSGDQALGGSLALRISMRSLAAERAAEEASTRGAWGRWTAWFATFFPDFEDWSDRRRVAALLTDSRRLERTIRPYLDGGLYVPPWRLGDLFEVVGDGVVARVIADQRPREDVGAIDPYYDAYEAELAWRAGDRERTVRLVESALRGLSDREVALRARLVAIAADAAWANGDTDAALGFYEDAMLGDPGVFRRLRMPVPAAIAGGGPGVPDAVVAMLWRSPRFVADGRGFVARVEGDDQAITICLYGSSEARLSCVDVDRPLPAEGEAPVDDDGFARLAAMAFHDRAFGLAIGSSHIDLDSLDGTTTSAGKAEREKIDAVLKGL